MVTPMTNPEIRPRLIDGEHYCAPLTCPARDTCIWRSRMNSIMSADAPCPPMLRRLLAEAREERDRRYTHEEVATWLFEYHGRYREKTLTEFVRELRAVRAAPAPSGADGGEGEGM